MLKQHEAPGVSSKPDWNWIANAPHKRTRTAVEKCQVCVFAGFGGEDSSRISSADRVGVNEGWGPLVRSKGVLADKFTGAYLRACPGPVSRPRPIAICAEDQMMAVAGGDELRYFKLGKVPISTRYWFPGNPVDSIVRGCCTNGSSSERTTGVSEPGAQQHRISTIACGNQEWVAPAVLPLGGTRILIPTGV